MAAEYQVALKNLLPVALIESSDISDAMVYLCGRSGRYITGITLPAVLHPKRSRFLREHRQAAPLLTTRSLS
jgi:hypothetical protein